MAERKGTEILIKLATKTLHGTTSKDISFTADMIESTTDQSTAESKEYLGGDVGGTISFSGNVDEDEATNYTVQEAVAALKAKTSLAFIYGGATSGDMIITGNGLLSEFSFSGPHNDVFSYSGTLQISGEFTIDTVV